MKRILFVEDDVMVSTIYCQKLVEKGFEVAPAEDGLAAMKRLREFKPDIVVLDLLMPKLSGLDVIKFMRENPGTKGTPVIVLSNSFMNKLGEEVARLGVEEMMSKAAATPASLIETINRILARPPAEPPPVPTTHPSTSGHTPPQSGTSFKHKKSPGLRDLDPTYGNESAAGFRKRIRRDFFEQIPGIAKNLQQACRDFLETNDPVTRALRLEALSRKVGFVTHMTGMAACYRIAQLASALEALLFELQEKPASLNSSCRKTVSATIALLADWLARAEQPDDQCLSPTTILVVDDDAVSNRALVFALSRVNLIAKSTADPFQALEKLRENSYDAVLLDINLPGISGIAVCEQMRRMPRHKSTPVIFISGHSEFEPAARSAAGVGDDFISKPIMPIELTVKVTAHVLKRRLAEQNPGL